MTDPHHLDERDHLLDELAFGCGVLWTLNTINAPQCDVCGDRFPAHAYNTFTENPFSVDNEIYRWGVTCRWCMASVVASGAQVFNYLKRETL